MPFSFGMSMFPNPFMLDVGAQLLLALFAILAVVGGAVTLVCYIFRSIALYKIATRRRIHHPWLSWIPVGSKWILGSIADQYQYVVKNRICSRRKILLILYAITDVLGLMQIFAAIMTIGEMMAAGSAQEALIISLAGPGAAIGFLKAVLGIVSLAAFVFQCIALFDLFTSCDPDTRVTFLVLGILIPFLMPIFLFADRRKDNGMPPRTDDYPHDIPNSTDESEFM